LIVVLFATSLCCAVNRQSLRKRADTAGWVDMEICCPGGWEWW
jgi:hypothetical protein